MKQAALGVFLFLSSAAVLAVQSPPQTPAWDVTLKTNSVAASSLGRS